MQARCAFYQGRYSEAEALYRQAVAVELKVGLSGMGWGHILPCDRRCKSASNTSHACMKQLANSCVRGGAKNESEWRDLYQLQASQIKLHEDPISGCVRHYSSQQVLGEEHPHTLTTMHNLANCLNNQSKHSEAETLHRQALAGQQKVSG